MYIVRMSCVCGAISKSSVWSDMWTFCVVVFSQCCLIKSMEYMKSLYNMVCAGVTRLIVVQPLAATVWSDLLD